jgi:hypothetical protein
MNSSPTVAIGITFKSDRRRRKIYSFFTARECHNVCRRHSRKGSAACSFDPGFGRWRRGTPHAKCLKPTSKLVHLQSRKVYYRGFNFSKRAHD